MKNPVVKLPFCPLSYDLENMFVKPAHSRVPIVSLILTFGSLDLKYLSNWEGKTFILPP